MKKHPARLESGNLMNPSWIVLQVTALKLVSNSIYGAGCRWSSPIFFPVVDAAAGNQELLDEELSSSDEGIILLLSGV